MVASLGRAGRTQNKDTPFIFPALIIFLALAAIALAGLYLANSKGVISDEIHRSLLFGGAGYLFASAVLALRLPALGELSSASRLGVALAIGLATGIATHGVSISRGPAMSQPLPVAPVYGPSTAPPTAAAPDDPFGIMKGVVPVVALALTVIALFAQKSAADARAEAKRAHAEMLRILNAGHLLELAHTARATAQELWGQLELDSYADSNTRRVLNLSATACGRLARLMIALHQWSSEPQLVASETLVNRAEILMVELAKLRQSFVVPNTALGDLPERLRRECWYPSALMLERLLVMERNSQPSCVETHRPSLDAILQIRGQLIEL